MTSIWHPQANDHDCYPPESERCTVCGMLMDEPCSPATCPRERPDLTTEQLDYYRREIEEMQAHGWDFDACQGMLDAIEGELTARQMEG